MRNLNGDGAPRRQRRTKTLLLRETLKAAVQTLDAIAGLRGVRLPLVRIRVDCSGILRRRRQEGPRALAQTNCHGGRGGGGGICVSSALLSGEWPFEVVLGVLAHEYGHIVSKGGDQRRADAVARKLFGRKIRYITPLRVQSF